MTKVLTVNPDKCTGCRLCEMACTVTHTSMFDLLQSRIKVINFGREFYRIPVVCLQCDVPLCAQVCPTGALVKDTISGIVKLAKTKCIGCRMCIMACPFGNTLFSPQEHKAAKCDLCEGDPQCVRFCVSEALQYREPLEQTTDKAAAFAERLRTVYRQLDTTGKGL